MEDVERAAPGLSGAALMADGADGNRTHDPLLAKQVLSQLSYRPAVWRQKYKGTPTRCRADAPHAITRAPAAAP